MDARDCIVKARDIWDPRCVQLLRERATARYARKVVPRLVDGTCIRFPEIEVSAGLRISVMSRRIRGRNLLEMLYDGETQELALDSAVTALKALDGADVDPGTFVSFGIAYRLARTLKAILSERSDVFLLSPEQRAELNRLILGYVRPRRGERQVLVHGDLHAGNLVVNSEEGVLGIIDLEMMHLGRPVTNFAQLWISFHFATPELGRIFYCRYIEEHSGTLDECFDRDAQAEVAVRCLSLIREARRSAHVELEKKAHALLGNVLDSGSFKDVVLSCHCV